jgi:hypothetical protein
MHIPLDPCLGGVTPLDADLVGVAVSNSTGCARLTQAVEGITLDAEATSNTS